MKIGYMYISPKGEQITTQQEEDAFATLPCDKIFRDVTSREKDDRPEFLRLLACAQPGDSIVIWRLDRLGRSLRHLIDTVMDLQKREINILSLTENIDTSKPEGTFTFHLFETLAEIDRDSIRQRTKVGLEAARARGRHGGRPKVKIDPKALQQAKELHVRKEMTIPEIMSMTGFRSKATFYKYVVNAERGLYPSG